MSGVVKAIGKAVKILDPIGNAILNSLTPKPPTRRLGELAVQTAQEGGARPIIWGRVRPIGGNLLHVQAPQKRMLKIKVSGSKKKQKVEHVFRTYAIGICEGPVSGLTRAWRNDKLVYDARGNAWGAKNNPVFLNGFRFYLGNYEQLPDSWLERVWGIGKVPAYRGTCYMVANNEDLTELGGAVPQWTFEVEREESLYIESALYPLGDVEGVHAGAVLSSIELRDTRKETEGNESVHVGAVLESIELKDVIASAASQEAVTVSATLESIELKNILRTSDAGNESVSVGAVLESIELNDVLIETEPFKESVSVGAVLESIELNDVLIETELFKESVSVGAVLESVIWQ